MYQGLLYTHTYLRYFILVMLVVVIVMAAIGMVNKKPYGKLDNKFSLFLLIFTHLQAVVGLILYFVSPFVKFSSETMKDSSLRYWTAEHITGMIVAVVLITVGRITTKKLPLDASKHRRMLVLNGVALVMIIVVIFLSKRGIV